MESDERTHLIWSAKHGGGWWKEAGAGYTWDVMRAGLFTEAEALEQQERTATIEGNECLAIPSRVAYAIVRLETERRVREDIDRRNTLRFWIDHPEPAPTGEDDDGA